MLAFSDKLGQTASTLKALSAEYRRRVLIGELRAQKHADAVRRFSALLSDIDLPTRRRQQACPPTASNKGQPSGGSTFVSKCALRKPVLKKPAATASGGKEEL